MHNTPKKQAGRLFDRLMTLDLCYKFGEKDNLQNLYAATKKALNLSSSDSIIYYAAEAMFPKLAKQSYVIIATGFRIPPQMLFGETDGPTGAAALARTLYFGYECTPLFVLEEELLPMMESVAQTAGLPTGSYRLISISKEMEKASQHAVAIINNFNPSCIISIERPGANAKNEYHTSRGINISEYAAKVDVLLESAKKKNILSIGVGDVGNELGLGKIREAIIENVKTGDNCQCPCKGGVAPVVEADIPIIAAVSNWGVYALAAMLSLYRENLDYFHDSKIEIKMIEACVKNKAVDGSTKRAEISVDALPGEIHCAVIDMMRSIVTGYLNITEGIFKGR